MRAPVQQKVQLAVAVAGHDDVLQTETFAHIVAGLGHFALVADENPCAVPDLLQLFGEDDRVGVQRTVHLVALDQPVVRTARCQSLALMTEVIVALLSRRRRPAAVSPERRRCLRRSRRCRKALTGAASRSSSSNGLTGAGVGQAAP